MLYETGKDRVKQSAVCEIVRSYLSRTLSIKETDGEEAMSHDFEITCGDSLVMIGEVKCRNYSEEFFLSQGWLLSSERVQALGETYYEKGMPVFYGFMTSDGAVYLITHESLLLKWGSLDAAPNRYMKNDHGTKPTNETGRIVPLNMMTKVNDATTRRKP